MRKQHRVIEHWIYFSCHLLEWEAFDPIRGRWMHLPRMISNEYVIFPDKESLAVGTELLVFTKDMTNSHVIYNYSLLTNSWTSGMSMNAPRCLFGSASLGEIAILAGGCDSGMSTYPHSHSKKCLKQVERYPCGVRNIAGSLIGQEPN